MSISVLCICYVHTCMHVRRYVWTRCARKYRFVSVPRQMPRVHEDSIAIHLSIYTIHLSIYTYVCMDIRLYLDTCTSERHRDVRVGVRLWRVRARWAASALAYNRRSECTGVPITSMRVCVRACMHGHFPRIVHVCPSVCGGRGQHARAVRGRSIGGTKVQALPEWLGQCKLLEELCVPRPPPPPPCALAAVPALRVALPHEAPGRAARRWMRRRRRRRCRSSAAAEPRARMAGVRGRPGAPVARSGWAGAARPHWWRAGKRSTASSRRCRRRSNGPI